MTAILWLLRALFFVGFIVAFGFAIYGVFVKSQGTPFPIKSRVFVIAGFFLFLLFAMLSSATYVDGTHRAVVENTLSGTYKTVGPGLHVWPFQPDIVPFTSKVTQYNMRRTRIEIGAPVEEGQKPSIAAGSSSPGNPVVYFHAAGWATPNADRLVDLHRRFGADYADDWVERNWVTALKATQGKHEFNYAQQNRTRLQDEVEENLQKELFDGDSTEPLVEVTQLAIIDFDYDQTVNARLEQLAQKQNETEIARQDQLKAEQERIAETTRAQTRLDVAAKDAETRVTQARGEAEAIRVQSESVQAAGGLNYIRLKWVEKWKGDLPRFWGSGSTGLFFNLDDDE